MTFWLNLDPLSSTVTFGSSLPDNIRKGETVTLDLYKKYDNWWTVDLRGCHYGGSNIRASGTNYAILDTGTSLIAISKTDYDNFRLGIMRQIASADCSSPDGCILPNSCSTFYPQLSDLTF